MLAGHIHSHGGGWKKCVETPFPVQALSGPARQKPGASQAARSGPGSEVCPLITQPTEAAASRGRDWMVSVGICHPPTHVHMRSSSPDARVSAAKGRVGGLCFLFLSSRCASVRVYFLALLSEGERRTGSLHSPDDSTTGVRKRCPLVAMEL